MGDSNTHRKGKWADLAVLSGLFIAALGALLWMANDRAEKDKRLHILNAARDVQGDVTHSLDTSRDFLIHLSDEISEDSISMEYFQKLARKFSGGKSGLINIIRVDSDLGLLSFASSDPEKTVIEKEGVPQQVKDAFLKAKDTGRPTYSQPFNTKGKEALFVAFIPFYSGDEFMGAVGGVYSLNAVLTRVIPEWVSETYRLGVLDKSGGVIAGYGSETGIDRRYVHTVEFPGLESGFSIVLSRNDSDAGHFRFAMLLIAIIGLATGTILAIVRLRMDIEKRVQVEEQLKKAEQKTRAIINTVGEGIIVIDSHSRIRFVNQELCDIFGYSAQELVGYGLEMLMPEKRRKRHHEAMAEYVRSSVPKILGTRVQLEGLGKNGLLFPIELRVEETRETEGDNKFFIGAIRDIASRKEAEESLKKSEYRLKTILETSNEGFLFIDNNAVTLNVNPTMCKIIGRERDDVMGKKLSDFLATESVEIFRKEMELRMQGRQSVYEIELSRPSGEKVLCQFNATPFYDDSGKKTGSFAMVTDITERKRAEEELRRAKDSAEEATKTKDKFVSLVSHDLKGPLGIMLGYLKLISNDAEHPLHEETKSMVKNVIASGEKMTKLIADLLNIGRIKAGKIMPNMKFFDIGAVASKVRSDFTGKASAKGIELKNSIPEGTRIYADETMLHEVLQNLLSNAIKFCNTGDNINIFLDNDDQSTIMVKDTGKGISPSRLKTIFNYETKSSTIGTAGETGTGLGLPLSRDIMLAHNGDLSAESEKGKGSVFYVRLPFVKPRILVVDDERFIRKLIKNLLKDMEADIIEAENGEVALEIVAKNSPHLLILDIMMPVMDGLEVLKRLGNNTATRRMPVIIITSDTSLETRNLAFKLGANDFISKPFSNEELIPRVCRYFL